MHVRRVVTAEYADGTSFIAVDDLVEPTLISQLPGSAFHRMWASDGRPQLPTEQPGTASGTMFPSGEGFRVMFMTYPPDSMRLRPAEIDVDALNREIAEKLARNKGDADVDPDRYEGNHRTNTVDVGVVLSGEVELRLDSGVVTLRQGDCLIQGGARHAWHNRTDEPCVVAFVLVGGERSI
jgi:mannose-6-phosphate isomerase-like protein (cupin superfamily)